MRQTKRIESRYLLHLIFVTVFFLTVQVLFSCRKSDSGEIVEASESLRRVLYVQSLYNLHPDEDIVPKMRDVIDSMRKAGRDPYYFAATNVLIDCLFSDGRFAEADSLAVNMELEALEDADSVAMAMARRVRAQMYYNLSQPTRALQELEPAVNYISNPYRSGSDFGTATSNLEWLWIISRELGDTITMNKAGMRYGQMVDLNHEMNKWIDSTAHYPVSALAFKAQDFFSRGNVKRAMLLLDSASRKVLPSIPSRAYEHLYEVRCKVRGANSDWVGAIADVDTLLMAHKDFPWFYVKDLLLKAEILNMAGKHEESADAFSRYIAFHDSLANKITEKRLHDLTVLYRTKIDREQKKAYRFRKFAYGSVIILLLILLAISLFHVAKVKKHNRFLVERLKEFDRNSENVFLLETEEDGSALSLIERLDRYMFIQRPYTNPALGRKELAGFLGISQEAVGQLIKNEKGVSVHTYINSFRLEEARKILGADSGESIAEIAARLGFGTSRTLQRAFKERYDMSPSQYKETSKEV